MPLARRHDWRLRDPKGLGIRVVREIRDEIQTLVVQLIEAKGWAREQPAHDLD